MNAHLLNTKGADDLSANAVQTQVLRTRAGDGLVLGRLGIARQLFDVFDPGVLGLIKINKRGRAAFVEQTKAGLEAIAGTVLAVAKGIENRALCMHTNVDKLSFKRRGTGHESQMLQLIDIA